MADTTALVRSCLADLHLAAADHQKARAALIAVAYDRLIVLAGKMLRGFPGVQEEPASLLSGVYERLERALVDSEVLRQLHSPADFYGLASLQLRRELCDLARSLSRERQRRVDVPIGDPASSMPVVPITPKDDSSQPDKLAVWTEFHEAIEKLDPTDRQVFEMIWYYDLKRVAIAELLGVDEKTIRKRYQSAQRRLTDLLGGSLPF